MASKMIVDVDFQQYLASSEARLDRMYARINRFRAATVRFQLLMNMIPREVVDEDKFNDAPIKPTVVEGSDKDGSGSDEMGSRKVADVDADLQQFQERMQQPEGNRVEQQETGNSSRSGILFSDKEEADQKHAKLLALLRNQQHHKHPASKPLSSQPKSAAEADKNHAELLSLLMNQKNNNRPVSHLFPAEIMANLMNPSKSKQPVSRSGPTQPLLALTITPVGPFTHAHKTFIQLEVVPVARNPRERKIWDPGIMFVTVLKQHLEDKVFVGRGVMIRIRK